MNKKKCLALFLALCMLLSMLPTAAFANEDGDAPAPTNNETVVCAQLEGCGEEGHAEGCPLYVAPVCAQLDGCGEEAHAEGCPLYVAPSDPSEDQVDVDLNDTVSGEEQSGEEQSGEEQSGEENIMTATNNEVVPETASVSGTMTAAEFLAKAVDGVITLDGDVTISDNCVWVQAAQSPLILDLKSYTIYGRVACYGGDLTIKGNGTIDTTELGWSPLLNDGEGGETHLTVEGGTFITSNGINSLYNMNGAVADIKGGSFPNGIGNGWWDGEANGSAQEGNGIVNISGGVIGAQEFDESGTTFFVPAVSNAAEVNISGDTIVQSSNSASAIENYGTMKITGGSVKAKQVGFGVIGNYYSGTITISDGMFVGEIENWFTTGEQPIQISGGTFSFPTTYAEKMQSYLVEGVKLDESGKVVSTIVAQVDGKGYTTLTAAFGAVASASDKTITLLADVDYTKESTKAVAVDVSGVTIDLNGKTVTTGYTSDGDPLLTLLGDFTLKNGKVKANGSYGIFTGNVAGAVDPSKVAKIEDVEVLGGGINAGSKVELTNVTATGNTYYAVWSEGDVTIKSGNYSSNGYAVLGISSQHGSMTVEGGTFTAEGTTPMVLGGTAGKPLIKGGTFNKDMTEENVTLDESLVWKDNGNGTWTPAVDARMVCIVDAFGEIKNRYWTMQEAVNAWTEEDGNNNSEIWFLADVNENVTVPAGKSLRIKTNDYTWTGAITNNGSIYFDGSSTRQEPDLRTKLDVTITCSEGATVEFNDEVYSRSKIEGDFVTGWTKWMYTDQEGWFVASSSCNAKIGDKEFRELQAAINAAQNGETVTLNKDNNTNIEIPEGKTITLDLNKNRLRNPSGDPGASTPVITNHGALTIKDGKNGSTGLTQRSGASAALVKNTGTLTIESGKFTPASGCATFENSGTITVKGGTFAEDIRTIATPAPGLEFSEDGKSVVKITVAQVTAADGTVTKYATLQEAITAAKNGDTVKLVKDVVLSSAVTIGRNITLDLNGHTISRDTSKAIQYLITVSNAELTVKDSLGEGEIVSTRYLNGEKLRGTPVRVKDGGTLNVQSGSIIGAQYGVSVSGSTVNVSGGTVEGTETAGIFAKSATVNLTGGTVTGRKAIDAQGGEIKVSDNAVVTGDLYGISLQNANVNDAKTAAELTMTGGKVSVTNPDGQAICGNNLYSQGTTATISGGTIEGGTGIYWPMDGTLNISGDVAITGSLSGIEVKQGTVNISGGTIKATGEYREYAPSGNGTVGSGWALAVSTQQYATTVAGVSSDVVVNITGGTFVSEHGTGIETINMGKQETNGTITISGDVEVNAASGKDAIHTATGSVAIKGDKNVAVAVSGGTFSSDVNQYCVADKIAVEKNAEGKFVVETLNATNATAQAGESFYKTLQSAIDATQTGTVYLLKDTTEKITVAAGKNITLELVGNSTLNGPVLKYVSNTNKTGSSLTNNGTLTITGSGTITRDETGVTDHKGHDYVILNNGILTIQGNVNIVGTCGREGNPPSVICNGPKSGATLTITGGTVKSVGSGIAVKNDEFGTLKIFGTAVVTTEATTFAAVQNWNEAAIINGIINGNVETWTYLETKATTMLGGEVTVNGKVTDNLYIDIEHGYPTPTNKPVVEVKGGTYSTNVSKYCLNNTAAYQDASGNWTIKSAAGTVSSSAGITVDSTDPKNITVTIGRGCVLSFDQAANKWYTNIVVAAPTGTDAEDVTIRAEATPAELAKGTLETIHELDWNSDKTTDQTVTVKIVEGVGFAQEGMVAAVNGIQYPTLAEAVADAADKAEVQLLQNASGSGIIVNKNITINFGGFTYTVAKAPLAGSGEKYATQAFQLLAGADKANPNTVKMVNGTIVLPAETDNLKMGIQNYTNLTLDKMTIDASGNSNITYVLSNNNGSTKLTGGTVIKAAEGKVAFDVYDYSSNGYGNVSVTVDNADVTGKIEVSETEKAKLEISGGKFDTDVSKYVVAGNGWNSETGTVAALTVTLDRTALSMTVGYTTSAPVTLTASTNVTPADGTVTWTSSNTAVATVDGNGVVTPVGAGTAAITATVSGVTSAACTVTVTRTTAPYVPPVTEPDEDLDEPDTPLVERPWLFTDVTEADGWIYASVKDLYDRNLINGLTDTIFGSGDLINRGQLAAILWRAAGSPEVTGENTYEDVAADAYYAKAILWATQNNIVAGYNAQFFGPNDSIRRQDLVVMLYRFAVLQGLEQTATGDLSVFTDQESVSKYAMDAMAWAVDAGVLKGVGGNKLNPRGNATRAEACAFLSRFLPMIEEPGEKITA